jgi:hypothetical protein
MALVKAKAAADERPINYDDPIAALIQRRRYQILVHSLLYYELDINLVSDAQWAKWGQELSQLQITYPDIASRVIFAEAFKGFDGSTGFHLPFRDAQVVTIAFRLLKRERSAESADALYKLQYGLQQTPAEYSRYKMKSHSAKSISTMKEVKPIEQKPGKGLFSVPRK